MCGETTLPLDIRSNDTDYRDRVEADVLSRLEAIAEERDLSLDVALLDRPEPVDLDAGMRSTLAELAETLDTDHCTLPSGGGHDAMNFQHAGIPTGMVFVPSIDGVSHNPAEETTREAIVSAAEILAHLLLRGP